MDNAILEKTITTKIELDGPEIAELFWQLSDSQQAMFFNVLGSKERIPMQLHFVSVCDELSREGKYAMARIGEYSN